MQGFAEADVVVEHEFRTPMVHQGYIEPHACVARVGADGRIVLWTTTQGPFLVRDALRRHPRHLDAANIKVIPSEIGGGFGGKIPVYLEPLAIVLSTKSRTAGEDGDGRATKCSAPPVRRPAATIQMKIGAKRDGTLVAASASTAGTRRAPTTDRPSVRRRCARFAPATTSPNFFIEALRRRREQAEGGGVSRARIADGDVCHRIAGRRNRATPGMDPIELRLKNAAAEGDHAPYGPKYGPIGLQAGARSGAASIRTGSAPLGAESGSRHRLRLLVQCRA